MRVRWALILGVLSGACAGTPAKPPQPLEAPRPLSPKPAGNPEAETVAKPAKQRWVFPDGVAAGELYASVAGQGVLRMGPDGFEVVIATTQGPVALSSTPAGAVFASFYTFGTARISGAQVTQLSAQPYSQLSFLSEDEAWGTPDRFSWEVHHFDGSKWSRVAKREEFKGRFDDNKLNGIAVNQQGVWVSSWNGLFLREGARWARVDPPGAVTTDRAPRRLSVFDDRLIASYDEGQFMRVGGRWAKLIWGSAMGIESMNSAGLAVGRVQGGKLEIGWLNSGTPHTTIDIGRVGFVEAMAVDDAGRIWIAGDHSLLALDSSGQSIVEYGPGTLSGLRGHVELLAVTRGGPSKLPDPEPPLERTLRGQVTIYKNGQPMVGARVEICASVSGCAGAPWSLETLTDAQGKFEFRAVPSASYHIHVTPPAIPECESPFTDSAPTEVELDRVCPKDTRLPCELPAIRACWPFEMPPR